MVNRIFGYLPQQATVLAGMLILGVLANTFYIVCEHRWSLELLQCTAELTHDAGTVHAIVFEQSRVVTAASNKCEIWVEKDEAKLARVPAEKVARSERLEREEEQHQRRLKLGVEAAALKEKHEMLLQRTASEQQSKMSQKDVDRRIDMTVEDDPDKLEKQLQDDLARRLKWQKERDQVVQIKEDERERILEEDLEKRLLWKKDRDATMKFRLDQEAEQQRLQAAADHAAAREEERKNVAMIEEREAAKQAKVEAAAKLLRDAELEAIAYEEARLAAIKKAEEDKIKEAQRIERETKRLEVATKTVEEAVATFARLEKFHGMPSKDSKDIGQGGLSANGAKDLEHARARREEQESVNDNLAARIESIAQSIAAKKAQE